MSEDGNDSCSDRARSSISVRAATKERFDTIRRQLAAFENEDMTGDETLSRLLDSFESGHDWAATQKDSESDEG